MQIILDIPDKFMQASNPEEITGRMKLATALLMFKEGQLSMGAACEFADIDRYTFLSACKQYGIPTVDYDVADLDREVASLGGSSV